MSVITDPLSARENPPEDAWRPHDLTIDVPPVEEFRLVLAMTIGWSVLVWLGHIAGTLSIAPRASSILLFGLGATNALFFLIARSNVLHRPPPDTIVLAQSVVNIAWITLFASMSSGAGELVIGMYASIVVFAMLRVGHGVLDQITVFAVISYSVMSLINGLSAEPASIAATTLVQVLIFAGIMSCLAVAARHVYRRHHHLENEIIKLRGLLHHEHSGAVTNSVNRRYIHDLLAREKGRTDRSNVPFCVCVFTLDHAGLSSGDTDEHVRLRAINTAEATIRHELRAMDSLNPTGFHECFGPYSDKEYIAILPQTNLHGAQRSTERVLTAIAAQHSTPDERLTLCGGFAEYHRGETISGLLARAEDALDEARASGVSRICGSKRLGGESAQQRRATIVRLETRRK